MLDGIARQPYAGWFNDARRQEQMIRMASEIGSAEDDQAAAGCLQSHMEFDRSTV